MNDKKRKPELIREELEIRIVDAADGSLSEDELRKLEGQLQAYPDLLQSYEKIMYLPDLSGVYGDLSLYQNDIQVHGILNQIEKTDRVKGSFEEVAIFWFKKYALAASLLILAVTSLFYLTQPETANGELSPDEIFYSYEQSSADDYVLYLDQWIDP